MTATLPSLRPFADQWAALLTTYRRDGRPVGTPVNIVVLGDRLVFRTYAQAYKFRRLERDQRVGLAPSTVRGTPTGPSIMGRARLLTGADDERAARAIDAKYPVFQRMLVRLGHRLLRYARSTASGYMLAMGPGADVDAVLEALLGAGEADTLGR